MSSSLHLSGAQGPLDDMTSGHLVLVTYNTAVRFRVAYHPDDLSRAHWRTINEPVEVIPWMFAGHQIAHHLPVFAEIEHANSTVTEKISTSERLPRPAGTRVLPSLPSMPSGRILYADCAVEPVWPLHHYADHDPYPTRKNSFLPMLYHSDGYGWATDKMWGVDIGETTQPGDGDSIIAARLTAYNLGLGDYVDLSAPDVVVSAHVSSPGIDLKNGYACFGVVTRFDDGRRGRYHLRRAFTIGATATENAWGLPSGSHQDWQCTFAAEEVGIQNMPAGPNLNQIGEIDIIFRDWDDKPIGELRVHKVEVYTA